MLELIHPKVAKKDGRFWERPYVCTKAWESFLQKMDLEMFCKECFNGRQLPLLTKQKKGRNIRACSSHNKRNLKKKRCFVCWRKEFEKKNWAPETERNLVDSSLKSPFLTFNEREVPLFLRHGVFVFVHLFWVRNSRFIKESSL